MRFSNWIDSVQPTQTISLPAAIHYFTLQLTNIFDSLEITRFIFVGISVIIVTYFPWDPWMSQSTENMVSFVQVTIATLFVCRFLSMYHYEIGEISSISLLCGIKYLRLTRITRFKGIGCNRCIAQTIDVYPMSEARVCTPVISNEIENWVSFECGTNMIDSCCGT